MEDILNDNQVEPTGMQFVDDDFDWNMYYFNHACDDCGSTFVISVKEFLPVITEPISEAILAGTERCESHCTSIRDIRECQQPCHYAPFRRFLLDMLDKKKAPQAQQSSVSANS